MEVKRKPSLSTEKKAGHNSVLRKDTVEKHLPRGDREVQGNRNQQGMQMRQAQRNRI